MKQSNILDKKENTKKQPSAEEAKEAVRTLISWAGDDPEREGLLETPKRVIKAYKEFFAGYFEDPHEILSKTFEEVAVLELSSVKSMIKATAININK